MSTDKIETKATDTPQAATSRMLKSFSVAAYITLIGIGGVLLATVFARTLADGHSVPIRMPTFVVFFAVVAIMLAAGVYLWIGMLYFLLKIDRRSRLSKIIWLLALLFFNTWAAAVYFFTVYRGLATGAHRAIQANA
ncbi:MAG: hypothetical protein ABSB66_16765 [Candidatus Acidiferrales bacterium]|jgi:hypothetical protein